MFIEQLTQSNLNKKKRTNSFTVNRLEETVNVILSSQYLRLYTKVQLGLVGGLLHTLCVCNGFRT